MPFLRAVLLSSACLLSPAALSAQTPAKTSPVPAKPAPANPSPPAPQPPVAPGTAAPEDGDDASQVAEGMMRFELISLPPLAARKALLQYPVEADLYAWLDKELENPKSGVVLERVNTLRTRSGQRSRVQAIDEYPYATEFDPGQVPQTMSLPVPAGSPPAGGGTVTPPWPHTTTSPTAFTFRNLGDTIEAELTFSDDRKYADINLAPESVRLLALLPTTPAQEVFQPVFETRKVSAQVLARAGEPCLVSSFSRPYNSGAPGECKEDRLWVLFVTVTIPR